MTAEPDNLEADDVNDDDLDMEMALFAMSASDVGGPSQDIDLTSLSAEEKRALITYLKHRFNIAPDPEGISEESDPGQEPATPHAKDGSV